MVFTAVLLEAESLLTTAEVRWLALASLALEKQPDNTYAIRPRVLGFYEEQGGDSPQRSRPVENNTLNCIL